MIFKSLAQKVFRTFTDTSEGRDFVVKGMRPLPNTPESILADATRIINYSAGPDYKSWEAEAWSQVKSCMDTILSSSKSERDVTLARGQLMALLDLIGIADKARAKQQELLKKRANATSATPRP